MRQIDFRVDVLKGGVRAGSLRFDADAPPSVTCDAGSEIHTSMSGSFAASELVDYLRDELQPVIIIDGVEYPAGVYRPGTVTEVTEEGRTTFQVEAYDRAILLEWCKLEERAYYAAGTTYSSIINAYLTDAGLALVAMTPTAATLAEAREWEIGPSYLQIINELLDELAYEHIWFDARGAAVLRPYQAPTVAAIAHTYGRAGAAEYRQIGTSRSRETDVFDKPNVFIVIRSGPEFTTPLTATAVNDFPLSPTSVTRRGLRIPQITMVDQIASQDALQTYANRLRDRGMESLETVTITTAIQQGHGVGDVVAIEDDVLPGIYRESGWSFALQAGSWMTHKLERAVLQSG